MRAELPALFLSGDAMFEHVLIMRTCCRKIEVRSWKLEVRISSSLLSFYPLADIMLSKSDLLILLFTFRRPFNKKGDNRSANQLRATQLLSPFFWPRSPLRGPECCRETLYLLNVRFNKITITYFDNFVKSPWPFILAKFCQVYFPYILAKFC